ncbi:hypothetical protein M2347_001724 [Chryseobacterium sp. H1D6B]|nr:hypothetical protein [Chryseobacterium sp. H1D6B]
MICYPKRSLQLCCRKAKLYRLLIKVTVKSYWKNDLNKDTGQYIRFLRQSFYEND